MKILIIKLSSLGDVLHNLPVVWDLRSKYPVAQIDWLVEEGYVHLITPLKTTSGFKGIDRIIPVASRRWKKELLQGYFSKVKKEFLTFKSQLQEVSYDIVVETQGLFKAAVMTSLAKKTPDVVIAGIGNRTEGSGYEPISRMFYTDSVEVPVQTHAVDRSRAVAAHAINEALPDRKLDAPKFYPDVFTKSLSHQENPLGLVKGQYVLCFHATARLAKSWDQENWIKTGRFLNEQDLQVILPWGNAQEKLISEELASQIPEAIVPRSFSIDEAFTIIAQARMTIGVDTGLTHLSAILNLPTIEIYVDSPIWKTEGYWSSSIHNLGDTGKPPSADQVIAAISEILK